MNTIIRVAALALLIMVAFDFVPVLGQINTACNASTIARFGPCMNLVTNSTANGTSPTADCCNYLRSLTNGGMDCLCLIFTASLPFQIPINTTLAISLPRACNMPGVPFQCKASTAPIPAPGPIPLGPALSPKAPDMANPTAPAQSPEVDTTFLTPPLTPTSDSGSGIRPELTLPSSTAQSSSGFETNLILMLALSCVCLKLY